MSHSSIDGWNLSMEGRNVVDYRFQRNILASLILLVCFFNDFSTIFSLKTSDYKMATRHILKMIDK